MPQRILNCGFFNLTDAYMSALANLDICKEEAFEEIRTRTYLPLVDNSSSPKEVYALVKAALTVTAPVSGDILIVSGTPDVVAYIMQITDPEVTVLCPLGAHKKGAYYLFGFREIVRNASEFDMCAAVFLFSEFTGEEDSA